MSEQYPDRLTPPADQRGEFGWFAFAPEGAADLDNEDPVIRNVSLRAHEHAGPFWDDEGHLSDDFDELRRWLGISRQLFDDAMAWNEELASPQSEPPEDWKRRHFARQQELLRRLGEEVHPGIEVEPPRSQPPLLIQLSRLIMDAETGHLVSWDEEATTTGQAKVLPPTPEALTKRVLAWIADAGKYEEATDDNTAAIFAWEDEGSAIARELGRALGEDYRVVAR
ncbi:hypothetical protein [Nocardioides conyzicola]|uniref:Uncharacterized protein n=1 Tax=Nocardioides conyzicola TaxID=1651781 RepID=A0ABP8XNV6_9ACTN